LKTLLVAFAIALLGIIVVFLALSHLGLDKSVAGTIASAILGAFPSIRESLDKQGLPGARRETRRPVVSFEGFGLSPQKQILYGFLILFAAMNLSSGFAGLIGGVAGLTHQNLIMLIKTVSFLVVIPATFLVGRWVGRRGVSTGIATGIATIFLIYVFARVAVSLLDVALVSSAEVVEFAGMAIWQQIVGGVAVLFPVGCLGYWRGRRQRLSAYLAYLLGRVSKETRGAIVELAYSEASRKTNPAVGSA
jgi:hypothetical protein